MVRGILCRDQTNAQCNSVCKYDIVIETQKVMAISESDIPSELILRQVDNVPVVSPEGTNWGGEKISIISRKLLIANVNWLKSCPKKTKRKSLRQPGEW